MSEWIHEEERQKITTSFAVKVNLLQNTGVFKSDRDPCFFDIQIWPCSGYKIGTNSFCTCFLCTHLPAVLLR